jgi:hypothetical protein
MKFLDYNQKYIYYSIYFFDFLIKDNKNIKDYKNITDDELKLIFSSKIYNEKILNTIFDVIKYIKNIIKNNKNISITNIINGNNILKPFMNKYKRNILEIYQYFYEKNINKNKDFIESSVYESSMEYNLYDFYRKIMKEWYIYIDELNTKYVNINSYWC